VPTNIIFRGRKDDEPGGSVLVNGSKEDVRRKLLAGEPVTEASGGEILVNWSNVLYLEEGYGAAAAETGPSGVGGDY
jgi:hypothetical protein